MNGTFTEADSLRLSQLQRVAREDLSAEERAERETLTYRHTNWLLRGQRETAQAQAERLAATAV